MTVPFWQWQRPQKCDNGHMFVTESRPWRCSVKGCHSVYLVRLSDLVRGRPGAIEDVAAGIAVLKDDREINMPLVEDPEMTPEAQGFLDPGTPPPITIMDPGPVEVLKAS